MSLYFCSSFESLFNNLKSFFCTLILLKTVFEAQNLPLKKIIEIGNWITIISTPEVEILKKKLGLLGVLILERRRNMCFFLLLYGKMLFLIHLDKAFPGNITPFVSCFP